MLDLELMLKWKRLKACGTRCMHFACEGHTFAGEQWADLSALNCVFQNICWNPSTHHLRTWPNLEVGSFVNIMNEEFLIWEWGVTGVIRRGEKVQRQRHKERWCPSGDRSWNGSDASASQGTPRIASQHQKPEDARVDPSLQCQEKHGSVDTLISDF